MKNILVKKKIVKWSKKIQLISTLFVLIIFSGNVYSDTGLKIGMVRDQNNGDEFIGSFKLGFYKTFSLSKNLSIQPEILISERNVDLASLNVGHYSRDKAAFIEIPLLLEYKVPLKGNIRPIIFGGGYYAFKLSEKGYFSQYYSSFYKEENNSVQLDYNDGKIPTGEFNKSDYGFVFGIGIESKGKKMNLSFDLRMNIGLNDIYYFNDFYSNDPDYATGPNRSISMSFGIGF